jgi:hypothetical protein
MADNGKAAKAHLNKISHKYQLRITSFEKKRDWLYKVYAEGKKKPFNGRQSAYTKQDVAAALTRMGYTRFQINPVLFDLPQRVGLADVMMFIKLSSTMLKDKMSFGKILEMLSEEQSNRTFKDALQQIESQLKGGAEGREVFSGLRISLASFLPLCLDWPPNPETWQRCLMPPASLSSVTWRSRRISRKP